MGWLKRGIGIAEVAAGALTANPAIAIKGGADIAGSFGDKKPMGTATPATQRQVPAVSGPPMSASSIEESRSQGRSRIQSIYKYP